MKDFRKLYKDEIKVRVGNCSEKGVTLLLFKDSRVDQTILDETVGPMNWQKSYKLIDGQLFCTISIWDSEKAMWISKEDVGTEGNMETQKSRASDAQKRAAVSWGIGRELYTAPRLFVSADKLSNFRYVDGKWKCYDEFFVEQIIYAEDTRKILALAVKDRTSGKRVIQWDIR